MRLCLNSLIFLLLAGVSFAAIGEPFVSCAWYAGTSSSQDNGFVTLAAWNGGSPSDFIGTQGAPKSEADAWDDSETGCTVTNNGSGLLRLTKADAFAEVVVGTGCRVNFAATYTDGYFVVYARSTDWIDLAGTTYSADTTADCHAGGSLQGIGDVVGSDLADASSYNCDVLIKGNETVGAVTVSAGGGSTTTLLSFIGVDASWDPIALTATSGWPEITNTGMIRFQDQNIQVRGLKFISNVAAVGVQIDGKGAGIISCYITNSNGSGIALSLNNAYATNCYIQSALKGVAMSRASLYGCTVKVTGADYGVSATASFGAFNIAGCIIQGGGVGTNGIFVDTLNSISGPCLISNNTIDDWTDCVHLDEMPDMADNGSLVITNNILSDYSSYAIDKTSADEQGVLVINNAFWDAQSTGNTTNLESLPIYLNITLTGDPYITQGTDYSLNNTAGAGAAARAAGFPGARVDGNNTAYGDVGAQQHQDSGGGGYHPPRLEGEI